MRQTNFVIARLFTFHHNIVISNQFISYSIFEVKNGKENFII